MPWVAAAAVVGSAVVKSYTANKAAKAQAAAAHEANDASTAATDLAREENKRQYDLNRADIMPTIERGNAAGNRLQEMMGLGGDKESQGYGSLMSRFTGADVANEPGYQFGLQQGQRGLDNSMAARGGYYSGAQLKAASRYNSDYAGTKFNDAYNRYNNDQTNSFNRLSGIAGSGQQATSYIGSQGANTTGQNGMMSVNNGQYVGNNLMGAGNARASAYLSQGNTWGNTINKLGSMYGG